MNEDRAPLPPAPGPPSPPAQPPGLTRRPDEQPLASRLVRGSAVIALASYFLFGFGFLANLVLTRLLTPADFGIYSLAFFLYSVLNIRPKIGIDQAFGQRPETTAESSGTLAMLSVSAGLGSLLLTLAAAPLLLALNYSPAVVLAALAFGVIGVADSVMGIAWVQLDKALLFARVSLVTTIAFPLAYIPAFWLALNGAAYWALIAQPAAYSLLLLIGLWWSARRYLPEIWRLRWRFSRALARRFLTFGVVVGAATIFSTLIYQFDNFLVGTFVGLSTLGFYDRAYRIAQWPNTVIGSVLVRTTFYAYSRLQDDRARLTKTASMSLWIITTLALPLAILIFIAAHDLVLFLFGEAWLPSALFVQFLVVYSVLRPLLDDGYSLFVATGHPRRATLVTVIQAAALVLAATPLTFRLGAVGTAVGVGVAFVVGLGVTYYFVRRTLPELSLRDVFVVPAMATLATLAGWALVESSPAFVTLPLLVRLLLKGALVAIGYFAVTFLVRPRVTRERALYVWQLLRAGA